MLCSKACLVTSLAPCTVCRLSTSQLPTRTHTHTGTHPHTEAHTHTTAWFWRRGREVWPLAPPTSVARASTMTTMRACWRLPVFIGHGCYGNSPKGLPQISGMAVQLTNPLPAGERLRESERAEWRGREGVCVVCVCVPWVCRMAQKSLRRERERERERDRERDSVLEKEREEAERERPQKETQETASLTCWSGLSLPTYRL